ncbi:hypothetical protein DFS34DRAFT_153800 [Phlyctochytrium arcticum]|nr:hypothetical protein DFS34DRAFT_153800 [Phlyctochytrium arcticum]
MVEEPTLGTVAVTAGRDFLVATVDWRRPSSLSSSESSSNTLSLELAKASAFPLTSTVPAGSGKAGRTNTNGTAGGTTGLATRCSTTTIGAGGFTVSCRERVDPDQKWCHTGPKLKKTSYLPHTRWVAVNIHHISRDVHIHRVFLRHIWVRIGHASSVGRHLRVKIDADHGIHNVFLHWFNWFSARFIVNHHQRNRLSNSRTGGTKAIHHRDRFS